MDSKNNFENEEILNQLEKDKITTNFKNALSDFLESELVKKTLKPLSEDKVDSEVSNTAKILTRMIERLDLFSDDKQKKEFSDSLVEILNQDESKTILNNPFFKIIKNMGFSLMMKKEGK